MNQPTNRLSPSRPVRRPTPGNARLHARRHAPVWAGPPHGAPLPRSPPTAPNGHEAPRHVPWRPLLRPSQHTALGLDIQPFFSCPLLLLAKTSNGKHTFYRVYEEETYMKNSRQNNNKKTHCMGLYYLHCKLSCLDYEPLQITLFCGFFFSCSI